MKELELEELESYVLGYRLECSRVQILWHQFTESTKTSWVLLLNFSFLICKISIIAAFGIYQLYDLEQVT